jgi:hypothetical protein
VHLDPNLQSVAGCIVLKVQARQTPQNFDICIWKMQASNLWILTPQETSGQRFWFAFYATEKQQERSSVNGRLTGIGDPYGEAFTPVLTADPMPPVL